MGDDYNNPPGDQGDGQLSMVGEFWLDTPAYSQRDKEMFVAGVEYARLLACIQNSGTGRIFTMHRENESRVRMACGRYGRECVIRHPPAALDPEGTWAFLTLDRQGDSRAWGPGDWRDDEFRQDDAPEPDAPGGD